MKKILLMSLLAYMTTNSFILIAQEYPDFESKTEIITENDNDDDDLGLSLNDYATLGSLIGTPIGIKCLTLSLSTNYYNLKLLVVILTIIFGGYIGHYMGSKIGYEIGTIIKGLQKNLRTKNRHQLIRN